MILGFGETVGGAVHSAPLQLAADAGGMDADVFGDLFLGFASELRSNGVALLPGQAVVDHFRFGLAIEPGVFATPGPLPPLPIALAVESA
jgi:hypothetical protein